MVWDEETLAGLPRRSAGLHPGQPHGVPGPALGRGDRRGHRLYASHRGRMTWGGRADRDGRLALPSALARCSRPRATRNAGRCSTALRRLPHDRRRRDPSDRAASERSGRPRDRRGRRLRFLGHLPRGGRAGEVWTENALDGFIANPDGYLPGTAMVFRGIRAAQDRADLIAFIDTRRWSAEAGEDTGPSPRSRRSSRSRATSPTASSCRRNARPAISAREARTFRRSGA
jgi:hypothetical protein